MPPLPPAGDVLRISLQFENAGKFFGSRFFLAYSGGTPSTSDCTAIATSAATAWNTQMAGLQQNQTALTGVTVEDLSTLSGSIGEWSGTHTGTRSGTAIALSTGVCIDFYIDRRYRGGKPKIQLWLGVEADLGSEVAWGSTFLGEVSTSWSDFIDAIQATTGIAITLGNHVNVSYYEGFTSAQNPVTGRWRNIPKVRSTPEVDPIVTHAARSIVGSQRRRLKLKA